MSLKDLALRYHAYETVDADDFQRRARILQSMWRRDRGYEAASYRGKVRGNRLEMPFAREELTNYLDEVTREVVRREVLDDEKSRGKLYGKPRIFNNLLSSQPLCFNLFAHLQEDVGLASRVFSAMSGGRVAEVEALEFEYSPGRGEARYTGDRSAFDVFALTRTEEGGRGFVGIEVKYHENLKGSRRALSPRHRELVAAMGCFVDGATQALEAPALEQIMRDHLLAGAMLEADDFDDGLFVFLSPDANRFCQRAVGQYRALLDDDGSFENWSLEEMVEVIEDQCGADWVEAFGERYLDFERVEKVVGETAG